MKNEIKISVTENQFQFIWNLLEYAFDGYTKQDYKTIREIEKRFKKAIRNKDIRGE